MQVHVPRMRSAVRLLQVGTQLGSSESRGSLRCRGGEDSGSWRAGLRQAGEGQERRSLEPGRPRGVQGPQGWPQLGLSLILASLRLITSLNENSVLGWGPRQPLEGLRVQSPRETAATDTGGLSEGEGCPARAVGVQGPSIMAPTPNPYNQPLGLS